MLETQLSAEELFQEGRAAWLRNDPTAAIPPLRAAATAAPENAGYGYALGCALLKAGDLQSGYPLLNRWRNAEAGRRAAVRLPIPAWSGQPVEGRHFLIWGEDGFGDQIMYMRYAVALVRRGARVSWICPPPLASLIAHMGMTPLPNDQPFAISDADFYCPSSALPQVFGVTFSTIEGHPFIRHPSADLRGARIGVVTSASPVHADGPQKTLPPLQADRLRSIPGAIDLAPENTGAGDFLDTASLMAGLELVISVDTASAHLAGGMGIKTLILLPYVACWRWFTHSSRSPWYDSAELVRQPEDGDWASAVDYVVARTR